MTNDLAPWLWIAAGVVVCALEALMPGAFLLWAGLAAIATGLLAFAVPMSGGMSMLALGVFAIVSVLIGRKVYGSRAIVASDRPNLNKRADALIGRVVILEDAIVNGEGRAKVNDSLWRVRGPDLPQGARVKIASIEGGVMLRVEAA